MEHPLSEKEMTVIFLDTLCGPYFDRLLNSITFGFIDLVAIRDRIEKGLKVARFSIMLGHPTLQINSPKTSIRKKRERPILSLQIEEDLSKGGRNNR